MDTESLSSGQNFFNRAVQGAGEAYESRKNIAQGIADNINEGRASMNMSDIMENTKKHMIENSILDPIAMPFFAKFAASKTVKASIKGAKSFVKEDLGRWTGEARRGASSMAEDFNNSDFGRGVMKVGQAVKEMNPEAFQEAINSASRSGGDMFDAGRDIGQRFMNGDHGEMPSYQQIADHINRVGDGEAVGEADIGTGMDSGVLNAPPSGGYDQIADGQAGREIYSSPADNTMETGIETDIGDTSRSMDVGADRMSGGSGEGSEQYGGARSSRPTPEADGQPEGNAPEPEPPVEEELHTSGLGDGEFTSNIGEGSSSTAMTEGSTALGEVGESGESTAMTVFEGMEALDVADAGLDAVPGLDLLTIGGDIATGALGLGILGAGQLFNKIFDPDKVADTQQAIAKVASPVQNVVSFASQFGTQN